MTRRRLLLALLAAAAVAPFLLPDERPAPGVGGWLGAAGLEPRFETLEGVRVRFVREGRGPAVVLLHGFGSSLFTWRDVLPALAAGHDVIALDLPGFGGSDQPADLDWALYPRVVLGLMDRLGVARASLVGSSMGGAVAVVVAARAPARVERLALVDAAGYNLAERERPAVVRLAGSSLAPLLGRLPVRRLLTRLALTQVFHDGAKVTDARVEEYVAPMLRPGTVAAIRSLMSTRTREIGEFPALAASVRAPTLVLWGAEDRWIPVEQADRFVAAIPGARKVVLTGCGHLPAEERPEETARLLLEHLDARSGS